MKQLTKKDALNLIDALNEWYEIVEPKELEKNEIGLNYERYKEIIFKLKKIAKTKYTVEIMPRNESPFRCEFEWSKVHDL
jgi:hypothetical protein